MTKRDKHWYASAIAFAEAKTEKEFLAIRSFYYTHYTFNELKIKYDVTELRNKYKKVRKA